MLDKWGGCRGFDYLCEANNVNYYELSLHLALLGMALIWFIVFPLTYALYLRGKITFAQYMDFTSVLFKGSFFFLVGYTISLLLGVLTGIVNVG